MKRVTHDADVERRQVVPKDFSFLSDADSDVVVGVASIVATLLGMSPDDPIILRGCRLTRQRSGDTVTYTMGDGLIMYAGAIYSVNGVPPVAVEGAMTPGALAEFAEGVVGDNAAHATSETADQANLASVGKVQEMIGEGRRVEAITSTPATPNTGVIYFVDNREGTESISIGTASVNAGTTAHVYHDGTAWVVVVDAQGGGALDDAINYANPSTTKAPTSKAVLDAMKEEYFRDVYTGSNLHTDYNTGTPNSKKYSTFRGSTASDGYTGTGFYDTFSVKKDEVVVVRIKKNLLPKMTILSEVTSTITDDTTTYSYRCLIPAILAKNSEMAGSYAIVAYVATSDMDCCVWQLYQSDINYIRVYSKMPNISGMEVVNRETLYPELVDGSYTTGGYVDNILHEGGRKVGSNYHIRSGFFRVSGKKYCYLGASADGGITECILHHIKADGSVISEHAARASSTKIYDIRDDEYIAISGYSTSSVSKDTADMYVVMYGEGDAVESKVPNLSLINTDQGCYRVTYDFETCVNHTHDGESGDYLTPENITESVKHYACGIVSLPKNYTPDGKPTRFVWFCNGSGNVTPTNWINNQDPDFTYRPYVEYLVSQGYAVGDGCCWGSTSFNETSFGSYCDWGSPTNRAAALAFYKYIMDKFNFYPEIFVFSKSQGGIKALHVTQNENIPVLATCLLASRISLIACQFGYSDTEKKAIMEDFGFPEIEMSGDSISSDSYAYPFSGSATVLTAEKKAIMKQYAHLISPYDPMFSAITNKSYAGIVEGEGNDDIEAFNLYPKASNITYAKNNFIAKFKAPLMIAGRLSATKYHTPTQDDPSTTKTSTDTVYEESVILYNAALKGGGEVVRQELAINVDSEGIAPENTDLHHVMDTQGLTKNVTIDGQEAAIPIAYIAMAEFFKRHE